MLDRFMCAAALAILLLGAPSRAQCPELETFTSPSLTGGLAPPVMLGYDDGHGPSLFTGGTFSFMGDAFATSIARWDGSHWHALGEGLRRTGSAGEVNALVPYDGGAGTVLAVGGRFDEAGGQPAANVATWDGSAWSALGAGLPTFTRVGALAQFDDGGGNALYAGTTTLSGGSGDVLWRFDGATWSSVGGGVTGISIDAMAVFDDGGGPALYVAGSLTAAGGGAVSNIARWDGASWTDVGGGTNARVQALIVHDDGGGPALYAGGLFSSAGGMSIIGIARWSGAWSSVGFLDEPTGTFVSCDLGAGAVLIAISWSFGDPHWSWNGTSWTAIPAGRPLTSALAAYDDGGGTDLYESGQFFNEHSSGYPGVWRRDGTTWSALGPYRDVIGRVLTLVAFDDGGGKDLYVGGDISSSGGVETGGVARWNGSSFSFIGSLENQFFINGRAEALAVFDDGSGAELFATGDFVRAGSIGADNVARWDGSTVWSALGTGLDAPGLALCVWDDGAGDDLYIGGSFLTAGGVGVKRIARWDGSSWSALGTGMDADVRALVAYDDGSGDTLVAGGDFTTADGGGASRVASWDGAAWSPLGAGTDGPVHALATFDDGSGAALYAGGEFTQAGGGPANLIARWDGTSWSSVGAPIGGTRVLALAVFDDGGGPALWAGGVDVGTGGVPGPGLVRWDGSGWTSPLAPIGGRVELLAGLDDGSGDALWIGGSFGGVGETVTPNLVAYRDPCLASPAVAFCFGTDEACPCGNGGAPDSGCDLPQATGGVHLDVSGFSPDGFGGGSVTLTGSGFAPAGSPTVIAILSPGFEAVPPTFGDGLRCISTTGLVRVKTGQAASGAVSLSLSHGAGNGAFHYQLWFRSTPSTFCDPNAAFNLSNGFKLVW